MCRSWWLFSLFVIPAMLVISGCFHDEEEDDEINNRFQVIPFDITKTQCPEIPAMRKVVEQRYQSGREITERIRKYALEYGEREYQRCLEENSSSDKKLPDCDSAWENLQKNYEQSVGNIADEKAYQDYQSAKEIWDACFKKRNDARTDTETKVGNCKQEFVNQQHQVEKSYESDMRVLIKERDERVNFLNELEKKCAGGELHLTAKGRVKAIPYQSKFLPLDQLKTFIGPECEQEEHWHAKNGASAKATDSTPVADPGGCGYGKTKDMPVMDVVVGE